MRPSDMAHGLCSQNCVELVKMHSGKILKESMCYCSLMLGSKP